MTQVAELQMRIHNLPTADFSELREWFLQLEDDLWDRQISTDFKAARRGAKRAIFAVAHRMLIAVYHMLTKREAYHDLGATYLDERNKTNVVKRSVRRLEQLGFQVTIEPTQPAAA